MENRRTERTEAEKKRISSKGTSWDTLIWRETDPEKKKRLIELREGKNVRRIRPGERGYVKPSYPKLAPEKPMGGRGWISGKRPKPRWISGKRPKPTRPVLFGKERKPGRLLELKEKFGGLLKARKPAPLTTMQKWEAKRRPAPLTTMQKWEAKRRPAPLTTMQKWEAKRRPMPHMQRARRLKAKTRRIPRWGESIKRY